MSSLTSHFWNIGSRNIVVKTWSEHLYALTQEQLQWETFRFRQWSGPALFFMHFLSLWLLGELEGSVAMYKTRWVLQGFWRGALGMTNGTLITVTKGQSNPSTGQVYRSVCLSSVEAFYQLWCQRQFTSKPQKYTGRLQLTSWRKNLPMFPTAELAPLYHIRHQ